MTDKTQKRRKLILNYLKKGKPKTQASFALRHVCSEKTIQRDISYLRRKGQDIKSGKDGYTLGIAGDKKVLANDSRVIATLLLACSAFDRRFACFTKGADTNIKEQLFVSDGSPDLRWYLDHNTTAAQSIPMSDGELLNFGELAKAILNGQVVRMYYTNIGYEHGVHHEVFPVQLKEREGLWYLLAYDYYHKARRVFALARMEEIEWSEQGHVIPDKVTIKSIQNHGNFSIWDSPDEKPQTVKIRLFNYAAWFIQERKIHDSQKYEIVSKDEVLLTLETGDLLGVKLWLRKFAPDVEVLEPDWFRKNCIEDFKAALANYE